MSNSSHPSPERRQLRARDLVAEFNRNNIARDLGLDLPNEPVYVGALQRYELVDFVGEGGMGLVFLARDTLADTDVAIKVLNSDLVDHGSAKLLLHEAKLLAGLQHRNVITVYDVGVLDTGWEYYVVMAFAPGGTLRAWQHECVRPLDATIEAYRAAGEGLYAAHETGVIHRDFKPDNIFVNEDLSHIVVGDFGLARSVTQTAPDPTRVHGLSSRVEPGVTQLSTVGGTPGYVAPELHLGHRPGDYASDQYSFCVALWEAVAGVLPFPLRQDEVDQLSVRPTQMPLWLYRVLLRGLSYHPSERYPTMRALLDDLRRQRERSEHGRRIRRVVLGVALAGGALASVLALRPDPCADASAAMQRSWSPDARADVEDALKGLDLTYSDEVAALALEVFDTAATRWRFQAQVLCEAESFEPRERARRAHCLELWHERMVQRVELLSEPSERDAERILELLEPLQQAEDRCATPPPVLVDADVREYVELSLFYESLADGEAALANSTLALEHARQSHARCDAGGDHSHELGKSLARHAEALARAQDYEQALEALEESASHALACEDDLGFIDARILSARILAGMLFDADGAAAELDEAEAMVRRVGATLRGPRRAQLAKAAGKVALIRGDFAGARERYREGLDALVDPGGRDLLLGVELQSSIGEAFHYEGRHRDAVGAYTHAQTSVEALLGPWHPKARIYGAQRQIHLGLVELELRNLDAARAYFEPLIEGQWSNLVIKSYVGLLSAMLTDEDEAPSLVAPSRELIELITAHPSSDHLSQAEARAMAGQIIASVDLDEGDALLGEAQHHYEAIGDKENIVRTAVIRAGLLCDAGRFEECGQHFAPARGSSYFADDDALRDRAADIDAALIDNARKQSAPPSD